VKVKIREDVLAILKPVLFSKESDNVKDFDIESCAICIENFTEGEKVLETPCRHLFHE